MGAAIGAKVHRCPAMAPSIFGRVMSTPPEPTGQFSLPLEWTDVEDLPLQFVNHLLSQFQPDEGVLYLTFGLATPPTFVGPPERVRAKVEALDSLTIKPIARLAVTPDKLREFVGVLVENLNRYEAAKGMLERDQVEDANAG
jgi:hypothetical protein